MKTLNLDPIELTSTERPAPKNGPRSAQDYNDSMGEILVDLASLTDFINTKLIPVLNTLPESAEPVLDGAHLLADSAANVGLLVDSVTEEPLAITQVLLRLSAIVQATQSSVVDISARVNTMQSALATTGANDIALAIQGFTNQMSAISNRVQALTSSPTTMTTASVTISSMTTVLDAIEDGVSLQTQAWQLAGVTPGMPLMLGISVLLPAGVVAMPKVQSNGFVLVELCNMSGAAFTPGNVTFTISYLQ